MISMQESVGRLLETGRITRDVAQSVLTNY